MWERAIARQSTLSKRIDETKRIDENLFAFWIKLTLLLQVLGAVTLDFLRRSPIHARKYWTDATRAPSRATPGTRAPTASARAASVTAPRERCS